MNLSELIEIKLLAEFQPAHLELLNESHRHAGPATDSHFKAIIVSDHFSGLAPVKRHQLVYHALSEELAGPVHALALHLYTPEEWRQRETGAPDSPQCAKS